MFRNACVLAGDFTRPVVLFQRQFNGECSSSIGSFVIVNSDGWIVTANHIVKQINELALATAKTAALIKQREIVEQDQSISVKERRRKLGNLHIDPRAPVAFSVWYGIGGNAKIDQWTAIEAVDLAVGQLKDFVFDPQWRFPFFKNPAFGVTPGVFLCKMGYPFHSIPERVNDNETADLIV